MSQLRNILVSVSGGRSSHYMAAHIREHPSYAGSNFLFAFANTGKERVETLDFIHECETRWKLPIVWLEADVSPELGIGTNYKIVNYATASRNGEPFEAVIKKYGIPNKMFPHCTRELKQRVISKFAKVVLGANHIQAIGIRVDEARRIKISRDRIYPLVEWGVRVETVRKWWKTQPFDLQLKDYEGNCDLCWKKSHRKKLTLIRERPQDVLWWDDMEAKYSKRQFEHRSNTDAAYFNRGNTPITTLVHEAKGDFESVTDPWMDEEQPCACMVQEDDEQ